MIYTPLMFLFGAILWRIRGASLLQNDTEARLVWATPIALLVSFLTDQWYFFPCILVAAFIGTVMGYWGQFDLTVASNRTIENYIKLTLTACFRFVPLQIVACALDYFLHTSYSRHVISSVLAGISFVPAYFLGIYIARYIKLPLLTMFTEWGEFLFGGILLTSLYLGFIL